MFPAALLSLGVVVAAEIGDKSQLLTLALLTRYRRRVVLLGLATAIGLLNLIAVAAGATVGAVLPTTAIGVIAGLAFLVFAIMTARMVKAGDDDDEQTEHRPVRRWGASAFLSVTGAFLLAELGDKTMLATATLAGTEHPVGVWLGATAGVVAIDGIVALAGAALIRRIPRRTVTAVAAVLFAAVGVWLLAGALREALS